MEELTRKTGNFKQFLVFVTMLESAINKVRTPAWVTVSCAGNGGSVQLNEIERCGLALSALAVE